MHWINLAENCGRKSGCDAFMHRESSGYGSKAKRELRWGKTFRIIIFLNETSLWLHCRVLHISPVWAEVYVVSILFHPVENQIVLCLPRWGFADALIHLFSFWPAYFYRRCRSPFLIDCLFFIEPCFVSKNGTEWSLEYIDLFWTQRNMLDFWMGESRRQTMVTRQGRP